MTEDFYQKFKEEKEKVEKFYAGLGEVWCPYLKEKIIFNSKGKEHLKFKGRQRARSCEDQYSRFRILKYAPEIVQKSHTVQGLNKTKIFENIRSNQRNEKILVSVVYYEFVSVEKENIRIRVIVKKIQDSQPYFWSVIPFWKKKADGGNKVNYGNPEDD